MTLSNLDISETAVWNLIKPSTKAECVDLISSLLDSIGGTLERRARLVSRPNHLGNQTTTVELRGQEAFAQPIGLTTACSQCMLIDPFLVARGPNRDQPRRQKHVSMSPSDGGYATVWLAKRPVRSGKWIKARAHQIICWSSWGPPRQDISDPVVLHWCDHRACINPDHLVFGERKANIKGGTHAREHAEQQMRLTRRQIPSQLE